MTTKLKVKNRKVIRVQMDVSVLVVYPQYCVADWKEAGFWHCPESRGYCTTFHQPREKNQNSKIKVQFILNVYGFHTIIKWKNHELSRCKLGTDCKYLPNVNSIWYTHLFYQYSMDLR